jgi:hypothetical protein
VPEGAVDGNAFPTDECIPRNGRCGIASLCRASRHIFGNDLPMGNQTSSWGGKFIGNCSSKRIESFSAGDTAEENFILAFKAG